MKTLTRLIVPLLLGTLAACGGNGGGGGNPNPPGGGNVTVSPKSVTLKSGDSATFNASVEGTTEPKILWTVEGDETPGTITSTGVYTAPTKAGTYQVVATNAVDSSKKDTAEVTVVQAIVVAVTPATSTVNAGGSVTFSGVSNEYIAKFSSSAEHRDSDFFGGSHDVCKIAVSHWPSFSIVRF